MTEGIPLLPPDLPEEAGDLAAGSAERVSEPSGSSDRSEPSPVEVAMTRLADDSRRYHERAAHREEVIDRMLVELDQLRRGERRSMLRPLLSELCRLRDDLLRQAGALPADFDGPRASMLLRSYAESIEIALADNGVHAYQPEPDDDFEPRGHRAVGRQPSGDPALVGRIAVVRRAGYRDVETNLPIAPAEVVVYVQAPPPEPGRHARPAETPVRIPLPDDVTSPAPMRGAAP